MSVSEDRELRLLLSSEKPEWAWDNPVLMFSLTPVYDTSEGLRNPPSGSFDADPLSDLQVRAQLDLASEAPYGWHVEYRQVYSVDLAQAERMVKTLRTIERKLAKYQAELGYPESFVAYAARVAQAIGAKQFGERAAGPRSMFMDGNQYRWGDATHLASWVGQAQDDFQKPKRELASAS